jgi:hypothetical protein
LALMVLLLALQLHWLCRGVGFELVAHKAHEHNVDSSGSSRKRDGYKQRKPLSVAYRSIESLS